MSAAVLVASVLLLQPAAPAPADVDAIRHFLLNGRIVNVKTLSTGVTRPRRVTLTDGTLTHDAVFQSINERRQVERFSSGRVELSFRDSWHFNIAAFELARVIGLDDMVPACVERSVQSERGSLCWWVNWKWDERMRVQQKLRPPNLVRWREQWDVMRVFRELVEDTDRNQTNMLIAEDWKVWMVDFSRAFRTSRKLTSPDSLKRCPRVLLERLRTVDDAALRAAITDHTEPAEIIGVLERRRLIVEHFDALVAKQGEEAVLF